MSETLWPALGLVTPLGARVLGKLDAAITGVSIDTRTLAPGDLFVALKGDNSDGHAHVARAFEGGAAAAVVDEAHARDLKSLGLLYVVRDTLTALEGLGRAARMRSQARLAAVTGSVGKTTTKEMLRHVLAEQAPTHASVASYNNHWGVPLTLARMPATARYGIFEIGMNHAGEITPLVGMVRPHVAIITRIAPVHLAHFESVDAIADAKAEIFSGVMRGGVAILNRDDAQFAHLRDKAKASPARFVLGFGEHAEADARLVSIEGRTNGSVIEAQILGQLLRYYVGMPGRHIVANSLAVLLAVRALGGDVKAAATALATIAPPAGRGTREKLARSDQTITLIDESYNANPVSMGAALDLLGALPRGRGRRVAVLGDMLELGPRSPDLHEQIADDIARNDVDVVFAAGPMMRHLYEALPQARRGAFAPDSQQLEGLVAAALGDGDIVMVKGSNGSRMGRIVARLRADFAGDDRPASA
jgi:UDP-N-acetylmuramoyl-tripeptide--D-alanyl-D-alanine ligase